MVESGLKLLAPPIIGFILYIREYGFQGLKEFYGARAFSLFALILWVIHFILLLKLGESWFCGSCLSKYRTDVFLMPSLGYALVLFPDIASGSVFRSKYERTREIMFRLIGVALIVYGYIFVLGEI